VKVLLAQKDINLNTTNKNGTMPLSIAAYNGPEEVVMMLRERFNVDLNTEAEDRQRPLLISTCHGHQGVVNVIFEQNEINPYTPNKYGQANSPEPHASVKNMKEC